MLYCIAPCCVVLCCAVLCYAMLCWAALCSVALCYFVPRCIVLCCVVLCCTVLQTTFIIRSGGHKQKHGVEASRAKIQQIYENLELDLDLKLFMVTGAYYESGLQEGLGENTANV